MKNISKTQKIVIFAVFAFILCIVGGLAFFGNMQSENSGEKQFELTIISERDNHKELISCQSDVATLGEFLRTFEKCQWKDSDYGIYLTGFQNLMEDIDNQYWWCVMIDGESATTGADEIPLEDGVTYEFVLKHGW